MNISYKWLKEFVDFDMTPQEVADALTSIGLEVEAVEEVQTIKGGLAGIVIGEVMTCEPHPNSDHMHVCKVNIGTGEPQQIVCGAPNVDAGQKVVVATLGTKLYDGDQEFTIKKSKLRGIDSFGMICAEDEIGIGTDHAGIIVLPQDAVPGTPAAAYYGLESDYIIEVDITPNHSDAASHWGVARDFYAYLKEHGYETSIHRPGVEAFKVDNHDLDIDVEVICEEACPRYCAVTVKNCEVKESPEWLRDRLTAIGLRPINNIVDITNYIMMAYGQPMHCFDADMVTGNKVVVKTMPTGYHFVTLDGVDHELTDRDLAICNAEEPMCIAGVFGGKGSGTYETTRNVLFESAYFHPTWIRKSARRHALQTDASFRFERGIDPEGQIYALKLAALMAKELAGGEIAMEIKDVKGESLPQNAIMDFSYSYCNELVGKVIPKDTVKSICQNLGMKILEQSEDGLKLEVPAFRVDVTHPCDVVEEILRIYGYNRVEIPTALHSSLTIKGELDRSNKMQNTIAEQLIGCGYHEILNNSLTKTAYYEDGETYPATRAVRLLNPLSQDLGVMRQTLLFGGLECIAHNTNRRIPDLKFFEFGNCYYFAADRKNDEQPLKAYSEDYHLALWVTGKRVSGSWAHQEEESSVWELKAYLLNIFRRLGVPFGALVFGEQKSDIFSKAATISNRGGKLIAQYGVVSKRQLKKCDVSNPVFYADINWTQLMKIVKNVAVHFTDIPKYPAVSRDLALLIDHQVEFSQIEAIACQCEKKLLKEVTLFDVYEGKNLEPGKKSYAVNFLIQDDTKTLNDKAIDAIMQRIITALQQKLGAQLR